MNINKIKKLVETLIDEDYENVFAALVLYSRIDYKQEIEDITALDIKLIKKLYEKYTEGNYDGIINVEMIEDLIGR